MDVLHHQAFIATKYAIALIGLMGNVLVTLSVMLDRSLQSVTFVAIGGLALSDSLVIVTSFLIWVDRYFQMHTELSYFIISNIRNGCLFSSALHITLIAVVRYIIVANPIRSSIILNIKKTFIASICIFIFSFIVFLVYGIITAILRPEDGLVITVCMSSVTYFLPVCSMIAFHIAKCKKLHSSLIRSQTARSRSTFKSKVYQRMSRLLAVVIMTSCVLPLPLTVISISFYAGIDFPLEIWGMGTLLLLLNSCINPFLYCFMSKKFRMSVFKLFCKHCDTKRKLRYNTRLIRTSTMRTNILGLEKTEKESKAIVEYELVNNPNTWKSNTALM